MRGTLWLLTLWLGSESFLAAAPPKLDSLFPAGGQRGQSVVVAASGEFASWPVKVWADRRDVTVAAEPDKGRLRVVIGAESVPGVVWLRAYNEEGVSTPRPLIVGTLPEVEEAEPNDSPDKPQSVPEQIVINGRLAKSGDVDGFVVSLQAGQTLVAALQANQVLASPMDGVLQVCELVERRGKPEAFVLAQNHDAVGLDPLLAFTARQAGKYLVRTYAFPAEGDAGISFAGSEKYIYRLTITTGAFVDHVLPMAVSRGQAAQVRLFGWNLPPEGTPLALSAISDPLASHVTAFRGDHAGSMPLTIVDQPSLVEPVNQSLELPAVISGQLSQAKQTDSFAFNAKKGVKLRIACESHSLGFPLRGVLKVSDESGKALASAEPAEPNRDTELLFTPPVDGRYVVSLADEHGRGGLRFVYRLTLQEARPDFDLTLAADSFVVAPDKPAEIPVTLAVREALAESIELKAVDLPAGVVCEAAKSAEKPQTGQMVKLVLKATPEAAAFSGPIRIIGSAGALTRSARSTTTPSPSLWLTVRK